MKRYRLAAMLTTAAMTVSFYGITVSAADDAIEKSWDGSYDTSWYDEQDTELHIFTAEELAGLAYLVNDGKKTFEGQTVFLESDVDLNGAEWPVIGYVGKEYGTFQGVFNGNNHLIANLTINEDRTYVGLFGYCENASIVNTRLADLNIYRRGRLSISQVSGGICSVFDNGTIENCQVQGKIRSAAGIGGIVSVAKNSNIRRCVSDIITNGGGVKQSVGGICGNAANTTFEECAALGTHKLELISYNLDDMYFAGICGKGDDKIIIKNCYSQFDISVSTISSYHDGDVDLKKGNIGGIVGVLPSGSIVENVFNAGILSTTGNAGGVICNNSNGTSVSNAYYLS